MLKGSFNIWKKFAPSVQNGVTPATVLIETYALSVSPTLPAIPLFTLAGFLLAEGQASARLLRVESELFV